MTGEEAPRDAQSTGLATADLLPVRMLNEYAYCARLFHLMHVQGRWADNAYTIEGRKVHKRVDKIDHVLPAPEVDGEADGKRKGARADAEDVGDDPPEVSTSVSLSSDSLGLTAKLDLVSTADDQAVPVERKRGRVPDNPERSWEPERVQLMAQGLLLREEGYRCDHGILYFAASRTRVPVEFTSALEARTYALLREAHAAADCESIPLPLEDSPKCKGCSLASICLPDETLALHALKSEDTPPDEIRRFFPARDRALPFYVQEQGAYVGKKAKRLLVRKEGEVLAEARLKETSQLVLCGNVSVSPQTIHLLCEAGIPVVHLSTGHWFYGITSGLGVMNGFARAAQYRTAADESKRLEFATAVVLAKGGNQRTMLMRNAVERPTRELDEMARRLGEIESAASCESLLGIEGTIAASYFGSFKRMFKESGSAMEFNFATRNRRPPRDPVNAMLSFGYALLAKECTVALLAEGLDPYWGLYHKPRHGRPGLALDLMEEFRPLIVDSAVITAVNTGMVKRRSFEVSPAGCVMKPAARKGLIQAYETRLDQLVTHSLFDYRCSWRAVVRIQARLLARWIQGESQAYEGFRTR